MSGGRSLFRAAPFVVVLLVGCASVTPEGEKVRVTRNPEVVKGCAFLGNISQPLMLGGPVDTEKALREKAVKLGADTVFVGPTNASSMAPMQGEAYRCGETK